MKIRNILFTFILLASTSFAARLTITSYGIPHCYKLYPYDRITFDDNGLFIIVTSPGAPSQEIHKYYLGYSNKVVLDTIGGPIDNFYINETNGTKTEIDFTAIDSLVFNPSIDSTGDLDVDGFTNYQELMIYNTDPRKTDSDGDGLDDPWECARNPEVYSPLVANLPALSISMITYPKIYLITSTDTSQSTERTVSDGSSWGASEGYTTTGSWASSSSGTTALDICNSSEAGFNILPKATFGIQVTAHQEGTYGQEQTHEVSTERQANNEKSYEQAVSKAEQTSTTLSGGKLSCMIHLANTGTIGITLTNPSFTLYGIHFNQGLPTEMALCDLYPAIISSGTSIVYQLAPGQSQDIQAIAAQDLTLDQVKEINSYGMLKVVGSNPNISYQPDPTGPTLTLSNIVTDVNASTARVIVDFDNCLKGQESPMTRNVATLTKFNPSAGSIADQYSPIYLGELLHSMGLTYHFDENGFTNINGLKRDTSNLWITQIIRSKTLGGTTGDTVVVRMGKYSGPDSVIVKTGDIVCVSYSGDDNHDTVPNCVAKMYGIYEDSDHKSKAYHDFDGDGISNNKEIYGWVPQGSTDTVYTDPANMDSDGDGISDSADPAPLVVRQAVASNLRELSVLNNAESVVQNLTFNISDSTGTLSKSIPCVPHFYVDVDTMALWIKVAVNTDTLLLNFNKTITDTNKTTKVITQRFRYSDDPTALRNRLPIDNVAISVITEPLNKGKPRVWKISGVSKLECALNAPVVLQTPDATKLLVQLAGGTNQMTVDPRTKGYYVFRTTDTSKALDLTGRTTMALTNENVNGWTCLTTFGVTASEEVSDTGLTEGFVRYYYRVVPYSNDGSTYYYGPSSAVGTNITNGYNPRVCVTDIKIAYGPQPVVPTGYGLIPIDLNANANGWIVTLVYKLETVSFPSDKQIITDLVMYNQNMTTPSADYTAIQQTLGGIGDLNANAGAPIALYAKFGNANNASDFSNVISNINVKTGLGVTDAGYNWVNWNGTTLNANCNEGTTGDFVYVEYTRNQ